MNFNAFDRKEEIFKSKASNLLTYNDQKPVNWNQNSPSIKSNGD